MGVLRRVLELRSDEGHAHVAVDVTVTSKFFLHCINVGRRIGSRVRLDWMVGQRVRECSESGQLLSARQDQSVHHSLLGFDLFYLYLRGGSWTPAAVRINVQSSNFKAVQRST